MGFADKLAECTEKKEKVKDKCEETVLPEINTLGVEPEKFRNCFSMWVFVFLVFIFFKTENEAGFL